MDIPEIPEERIIVLDNKILLGKLSLWTSEFFKEVKACLRFFGTRTCRRSLKIQAVSLVLEKSQQYAATIHSVSQSARGCKKNLRDWAFSQLGQTHLTFMNTIMTGDILIRRISDHQRVAGLQDYEWQTSPLWFCWSSLSPLISSSPWAFCPTLSVSLSHTFLPPG